MKHLIEGSLIQFSSGFCSSAMQPLSACLQHSHCKYLHLHDTCGVVSWAIFERIPSMYAHIPTRGAPVPSCSGRCTERGPSAHGAHVQRGAHLPIIRARGRQLSIQIAPFQLQWTCQSIFRKFQVYYIFPFVIADSLVEDGILSHLS